ncbi:hypothetical protein EJ02DRAFT_141980 [Clathrospora elynae]|uniref:Uncharacterized protein n=1 Tax=Clathrospora elynae TaxID=706981 RepID=A0A6A5SUC6_9PLEO|nr:hypothetical protein EJ02DRAFT_141980 [Clathrospora elynae]
MRIGLPSKTLSERYFNMHYYSPHTVSPLHHRNTSPSISPPARVHRSFPPPFPSATQSPFHCLQRTRSFNNQRSRVVRYADARLSIFDSVDRSGPQVASDMHLPAQPHPQLRVSSAQRFMALVIAMGQRYNACRRADACSLRELCGMIGRWEGVWYRRAC